MNKRKGTAYVEYTYGRKYIPEKRYNIPQRTTIGKADLLDPTMMHPNQNFVKYFPDVELPEFRKRSKRSGCIRIGSYVVIKKIIEEYRFDEMMANIIGKDSGLFLDLVAYSIVTENNAGQYYPEYGNNHPLFTPGMKIYSDTKVSDFLSSVTPDQNIAFLDEWNAARNHREKTYISYDSTNKSCQAGDVETKTPLFYEEYPGSIIDVAQLQIMLNKAEGYGYKRAGFIVDRGYFSRANLRFMDRNGYSFVMRR